MTVGTGLTIGKYVLGKKLGQGGFGSVFNARDTSLDREVALKFMHAEHTANPEILARFLQEARSAAKVVHPGIVTVFECGQVQGTGTTDDGVAYIAMELLHGESLAARLARNGRLSPDTAIEITRQIASALAAAHDAGIVHRDLKPDNLFIVVDPAMHTGERIKVLDFGIAKLAQPAGTTSGVQTHSMMVFGTPRYMSPEQCRSAANIDRRSDIYTLGCILFELVTGKPPFEGEFGELIALHQLSPAPTALSVVSTLPLELDALIAKMIAKQPDQRPQTMAAVQRALEGLGSGAAPTMPPIGRPTPMPLRDDRSGLEPTQMSGPAPAVANATTLGAAAGQKLTAARPRSKLPWFAGGIASAVIAGVVVVMMRATDNVAEAPPPAAAKPPPEPPKPAEVELTVTSPQKAEVYSVDHLLFGPTPYSFKRPPAQGRVVLFVRADGFVEQRVDLPADRTTTREVTLAPLAPVAPVAVAPPATTTDHKPAVTVNPQPKVKVTVPVTRPKRPLKPGELPDD